MYFLCACFTDKVDDTLRGRTSYNAVVNEDNTLIPDGLLNDIELYLDGICAFRLGRLDKCSADIAVFDKSYSVGDSRCVGKSECCIKSAVGYADNYISIDRVLLP